MSVTYVVSPSPDFNYRDDVLQILSVGFVAGSACIDPPSALASETRTMTRPDIPVDQGALELSQLLHLFQDSSHRCMHTGTGCSFCGIEETAARPASCSAGPRKLQVAEMRVGVELEAQSASPRLQTPLLSYSFGSHVLLLFRVPCICRHGKLANVYLSGI
jgi:hypothetical protein